MLYLLLELKPGQPKAMPPGKQLPQAERDAIKAVDRRRGALAGGSDAAAQAARARRMRRRQSSSLHARIAKQTSEKTQADMKPYKATIPTRDVSFDMVPIPGGEFMMGTPDTEAGRKKDEGPQRKVKIEPFWMGKYEVTWDEYRLFMFSQHGQGGREQG